MEVTPGEDQILRNPPSGGLRSPNVFVRYPAIGTLLFIFGVLVFAGFFYNLRVQGPLFELDKKLAISWPAMALNGPPYLKTLMDAGFYIGDQVILGLGVLLGFYFIIKKYWQEFWMLAIGLAGSSTLFLSLSNIIGRVRPATQIWIIEKIPGFPSGHAITIVVFYGLLAYLIVPRISSAFWKVVVVILTLLIICFVGFSRVFTGGHYLTDVLAGYAIGIAWFGLAYTLIEVYFKKRRNRNVQKG